MINCIGTLTGSSGYASHFRGVVNELNKLEDCKIVTNLPVGFEKEVNDNELKMLKREQDFDINLIITHPLYWRSNLSAKRNFVYLVWEGDLIPKWMLEECLNHKIEKIIVPSEHTKKAILNTLEEEQKEIGIKEGENVENISHTSIKKKLVVIPHGYNPEDFYSQQPKVTARQGGGETSPLKEVVKPSEQTADGSFGIDSQNSPADNTHRAMKETASGLNSSIEAGHRSNDSSPELGEKYSFKFLANKGFRNIEDRGGIQYLIKAYLSEFKPEENVELVLKVNPAYGIPNLLELFPELNSKHPKITYIPENYTTKQLNELYNECDVFVSPTRAEAFNLPCLEALACGKPVITTNYGGQTDFIDNEVGALIDYKLTEITHEVEYEGINWATPNHEQLKKELRRIYTNGIYGFKENCIKRASKYTWKNTAKQIYILISQHLNTIIN